MNEENNNEENNRWSSFLSNFQDLLALVRQVAILSFFAVLIFQPTWLTTSLKKIGLALGEAGFTEVNFAGLKQDLEKLREQAKDTELNTQQSQESLEKAVKLLQQEDPKIEEAISQINKAQEQLGFAREQIKEISSSQPSPQSQISDQWGVVIGADSSIEAAKDEVNTAKNRGFEDVMILRRDGWYRTVIRFSSKKEAEVALPDISNEIRESSYIRNLNEWCEIISDSKSQEFKECK